MTRAFIPEEAEDHILSRESDPMSKLREGQGTHRTQALFGKYWSAPTLLWACKKKVSICTPLHDRLFVCAEPC